MAAGSLVGEAVDERVGDSLSVDGDGEVGEGVGVVGVAAMLADQVLRLELAQQRRRDGMQGAEPPGVAGAGLAGRC